jgi:hypothetical protein
MASLHDLATPMLLGLNDRPAAAPFLAAYDMRIQFSPTDGEPFHAVIAGGRVQEVSAGPVDGFSNAGDIELFGAEDGFRLIFERVSTPATALIHGRVTPRGERAKHNQAAVTFCLLRIAQEWQFQTELPRD